MKRSRGVVKRYVESSDSEDERPLKKSPPVKEKKITHDGSSSSESDIETYLHKPEKLDFNSDFFNTKPTNVSEFYKIEKNIFSEIRRLSDSESDADKEIIPSEEKVVLKDHSESSSLLGKNESIPSSRLTFNQLQDYTKKIEEAKRHIEIYKAKKQAQENKTDILNLLTAGERKTGIEHTISPADLHSSDFESCDSEQEDWEEIKIKASQETKDKNLIPTEGLQITVDMPDNVRKKRGIDLVAAMKRRLNRIRKENQVLVHRVHLLCWIAHGNYVNTAINDTQTMAMALSLLPSEQCYPSDRIDLTYLEQIVAWYKRTVKLIDKVVPEDMPLAECLQSQINRKEAYNKKMLAVIFVAVLRALGTQARIVMSLQVEPLRPPSSDLHSLSTKENKDKMQGKAGIKGKGKATELNKINKQNSTQSGNSGSKASTSGKIVEKKIDIKINIHGPSPDKVKKNVGNNKNAQINPDAVPGKLKSKKSSSVSDIAKLSAAKHDKPRTSIPEKKSRAKSAESSSRKNISQKTPNINKKNVENDDKLKIGLPKSRTRAKSTESINSVQSNSSQKSSKKAQNCEENVEMAKNKGRLGSENQKMKKVAKSMESIDSTPNINKNVENDDKLKIGLPKSRTRAKSTESINSVQSNSSQKSSKKAQNCEENVEMAKNKGRLGVENQKMKKVTKSMESIDSMQSTQKTRRTQKSKDVGETRVNQTGLKPDNTQARNRAKSTESIDSLSGSSSRTRTSRGKKSKDDQEIKSNRRVSDSTEIGSKVNRSKSLESMKSTRVTKTRNKKVISQVDGICDSDSDIEMTLLQLDGANDKQKSKEKPKPNLRLLKKPPAKDNAKKDNPRPNLKSLANKANQKKTLPKKTEESNSDSDFEPAGGSPFKRRLERAAPDLNKLKNIKRQSTKQVDITNDIVSLVKGRISEQKRIERGRLVKKRKPDPESDSDSDYAPEPIKKKHHDSEDDFVPKTKVKRRLQVHPVLSDSDTEKKKKKGNDVWIEVFLEAEEKWISVDVVAGQVHCIKEISQRATRPIAYVLAWDNNNNLKDVTQRYCHNFNTVTRKLRIGLKWWNDSLKPFMGLPTTRDKDEDDDLARQQLDQPLPKAISEYKDHPLYALRRHLLKFEAIYPPEPATLGFIRGEAVYARRCVYTLHSRDIWLKQAKVVKLGEQPYKIVKARPKWDKLSNKVITDQMLEIFGPWQVQDYDPPTAEDGVVPKNAFGNVDLFKPCMLPKGCVHLKLPGLNKIARRMNIDCASAIIGFDFHNGWSHPLYDGFVVCQEYEDQLICAWELEQEELERKEQEKIDKRVYGNWKKLIRGLLIRERLKAKYDFGQPSTSDSNDKKKAKGPKFCTKKR